MSRLSQFYIILCSFILFTSHAQNEGRLFRFPAVYNDQVVFTYGGDLYTTSTSGGTARKLTSHIGYESFPKFSHDGKWIAFSAQYDGNTEVYIIPAQGGQAKRITYTATLKRDDISDRMGPNNIVMGWTPDDKHVIYRSRKKSFDSFKGHLYKAPVTGDLSEPMPFSVAGWCSYNEDGSKLAYNRVFREFRTWKYYRGGMADDIWLFDPATKQTENLTSHEAQDIFPMFYKNKVYFASDRDRIMNLFEVDLATKQTKKITNFTDYDIKYPSLCKNIIAFEQAGYIHTYDLTSNQLKKLTIQIEDDYRDSHSQYVQAGKNITSYSISPDGSYMAFAARGDIIIQPTKHGVIKNLTRSSGVHERAVAWSPDGKWLAYISDQTGENEIFIIDAHGESPAKQLTTGGGTYKYKLKWSPNSQKIMWYDKGQNLYFVDITSNQKTKVYHSDIWEVINYTWSPDSKWVVYGKPMNYEAYELWFYNLSTKKQQQINSGRYPSALPIFSTNGDYLFFIERSVFNPIYNEFEWNHAFLNSEQLKAFILKKDQKSPFEEGQSLEQKQKSNAISVQFEDPVNRIVSFPILPARFESLATTDTGFYYLKHTATDTKKSLCFFNYKTKKETIICPADGYQISQDQKMMVILQEGKYYVEDLPSKAITPSKELKISDLRIWIDFKQEWNQIFNEGWRQMRDFFYDPNMHGVDWEAMKKKYEVFLPFVNHRKDLTYIMGEMIGELNVGHAYVSSGRHKIASRIPMGLLGALYKRDASGYYQITKILKGDNSNDKLYAPLMAAGVNVSEGNYILAINGVSTKEMTNINQGLIGTVDKLTELTINSTPSAKGARKVLVKPIASESSLYYYNWVEENLAKVTKATGGKVGYLHIPNMLQEGLIEFGKYFYAQLDKNALIIDDRSNGGGNVSPMIIERLRREVAIGEKVRNSAHNESSPYHMIDGPKVCLIDQFSASDGDLFPYQFRHYNLGPIMGQRSWGGTVGTRGSLPFIDGGSMNKPEFGHYTADGKEWIAENIGIIPDIEVINDPYKVYNGQDDQLDRAIKYIMDELEKSGDNKITPPPFPDKSK